MMFGKLEPCILMVVYELKLFKNCWNPRENALTRSEVSCMKDLNLQGSLGKKCPRIQSSSILRSLRNGGSASSRTHASRLAEEWDRDPNSTDIFEYMHTKMHDKKTFINKKSAEISEKLNALRAERCQPTDGSSIPQLVDENRLFYDAVGGRNKRNMIYGLGSTQDIFYGPSSSTVSHFSDSQPNTEEFEKLENELQKMK
ncbi:hypothetical protein POM88_045422 [Heracleum sosnowskyi]|uniref:Uncharacterized protein n=1 Tax=Heracleum sosnowskyi TaxID=360622 RepID=A0AAD8M6E4_9APIA|nr:hypothetical protein POM88_045422 [Heracleum sosnowskyi]